MYKYRVLQDPKEIKDNMATLVKMDEMELKVKEVLKDPLVQEERMVFLVSLEYLELKVKKDK